ncbi:maleylpyruvate isomerase family mycothiol-dependent enzyme [Nocardioides litoris]|uniref:maleylpyruvate isomerase family mycothiol-dependent enzyme n=1 Tax=Nocardioides litoris TaxID=1926648 RepID=UPI0011230521|nr:maleylpyruvate isomerase family mycothiol-dependent enzyme [Nocardioides litoris]
MSEPDDARLAAWVETWWQAVQDFCALLDEVPDAQWTTPTDLAGWDVRACAAHTAHLESVLAGRPEETAEVGEPPHVTGLMGLYTEIGVVNRRDAAPADIVAEIREVTALRHEQLLADPPTDPAARPTTIFGGVPWTWETLLRNRPLDVWMHEQDVRRAVGRPGGLDSPAAAHTADYLAEGFGYVLAKKAAAPPGTTAVLDVEGSPTLAFAIGDDGRGRRLPDLPADPTLALRLGREAFVVLAGGRRTAEELGAGAVTVEGDADLGRRVLSVMATTP